VEKVMLAPELVKNASIERRPRGILCSSQANWAVRLALSAPFAVSGITKLVGYSEAVAEFTALGIWLPQLAVAATIAVQIVGSALLLASGYSWIGACLLAAFTGSATLIGHPFWQFAGAERAGQMITFLEHLALMGGLMAAAIMESGSRTSGSDRHGR
jgi:uncharacterized membrane protein YphA (DoxX/SURF4 family)